MEEINDTNNGKSADDDTNDENNEENIENVPLCYCGEELQSDDIDFEMNWHCKHCFELYNKRGGIYYWCFSGKQCKYNKITDSYYNVCHYCFNAMKQSDIDIIFNNEKYSQFILKKIKSQIKYIKNTIIHQKTLKNSSSKNCKQEQFDKYLEYLYCYLYQIIYMSIKR